MVKILTDTLTTLRDLVQDGRVQNQNITKALNKLVETNDHVREEAVLYRKIETHTTRRSAARNLFDSGMPPEIIMTLGGWTNMKQLLEYIDIDLDYAASKAAEHPFFK